MTANIFYIVLNIKTGTGFESFGEFRMGNNRDTASKIFAQLKGDKEVNDENVLQLDLREVRNGLPVNVELITCTLEELAENCRILTKEMFKLYNLEPVRRRK